MKKIKSDPVKKIILSRQQLLVKDYPSKKLVVALGTGSGKTIATLSASRGAKLILVVMPKILKEEKTWEKNQEKIGDDTKIITISKEQFRKYHRELPKADTVIFDEYAGWACGVNPVLASKNKVPYIVTSQLHDACMWYLNTHKPDSIYLLDASASANKPMALWATKRLLGTLNPKMTDMESFIKFRDMFHFKYKKGYTDLYLVKKDKKTKQLLSDYWKTTGVFFDTEDKIEPIEETIFIAETPDQYSVHEEIDQLYSEPLVLRCRHYMASNGVYTRTKFDDQSKKAVKEKIIIPTEKELWIVALAKKKKQFIVFATFTGQINSIKESLEKNKISVDIITGQVKDQSAPAQAFRDKKIQVLIVQSSICQGWEAPHCEIIVRASQPIRADHALQQAGRIDRPHIIKKQNYIYNLVVRGGPDEESYKIIKRGEDIHWLTVKEDE